MWGGGGSWRSSLGSVFHTCKHIVSCLVHLGSNLVQFWCTRARGPLQACLVSRSRTVANMCALQTCTVCACDVAPRGLDVRSISCAINCMQPLMCDAAFQHILILFITTTQPHMPRTACACAARAHVRNRQVAQFILSEPAFTYTPRVHMSAWRCSLCVSPVFHTSSNFTYTPRVHMSAWRCSLCVSPVFHTSSNFGACAALAFVGLASRMGVGRANAPSKAVLQSVADYHGWCHRLGAIPSLKTALAL